MFDKLIQAIEQFGKDLLPIFVVDEWEMCLVLRLGKKHKIVGPGAYLKIPFADQPWPHTVVTQSMDLPAQSVTTFDGIKVVVKGVVRFSISNIELFLTKMSHPMDVIMDTVASEIRGCVEDSNWDELTDLDATLLSSSQRALKKYGITVERVTLTDLQETTTIRIIGETNQQGKYIPLVDN